MTSKSAPLAVYVFLIVLFYNKTDGFQKTAGVFNYCFFKSIPVFALSALVYFEHGGLKGANRTSHALGLFFGACGDFIISFHQHGLVTGAVAFALGHLAYMGTFALQLHKVSGELATVCLLYALFVNHYFLMPQFWFHPISTLILMGYSLILGTALVTSGSLYFRGTKAQSPRQMNNLLRFLGYALFFLSDSMLLLDHAGQPLPYPAVLILCTYYASQYFILMGSVHSEQILESPTYLKNRAMAKASM